MLDWLRTVRWCASARGWRRGARRSCTFVASIFVVVFASASASSASDEAALWRTLASKGHFALLRHAIAPGVGDPPEFAIGDCGRQRILSEEGRQQAQRIGRRFRANGIVAAQIFSSQWCRCLDTARRLGLGPVTELPILNSFFQWPERRSGQMRALETWLAHQDLNEPLILVTHQVNIAALTGIYPASGELVIVRRSEDGTLSPLGRLRTD